MSTWSVITVLACAQLSGSEVSLPQKRALHEHPTLVRLVELNNQMRAQYGLAPQRVSPELTLLAQRHAEWMASTGSFVHNYSHGYPEIIYTGAPSVESAINGWMNSGPHRGIMLSGNTAVGYGYYISPGGQTYWCGVFGNFAQ
jgi:uncharacterized protein YkwD